MSESKFCSLLLASFDQLYHYLPGGGRWGKLKLKLTQPQVEIEAWAEIGENNDLPKLLCWSYAHPSDQFVSDTLKWVFHVRAFMGSLFCF